MTDKTNEIICPCGHNTKNHFDEGCGHCGCDLTREESLRSRLSALQTAHEEDGRKIEQLTQANTDMREALKRINHMIVGKWMVEQITSEIKTISYHALRPAATASIPAEGEKGEVNK